MDKTKFKTDLARLNSFLKSSDKTMEINYTEANPYYLKYFCKLLGARVYNRLGEFFSILQNSILTYSFKKWLYRLFKVKIGKNVYMGPYVVLDPHFPNLVTIGDNVIIGLGTKISTHEIVQNKLTVGRVNIGSNVVIGAYAFIRCGVTIGDNAQIAMGSVVLGDVPANAVFIGNPGRIVQNKSGQ